MSTKDDDLTIEVIPDDKVETTHVVDTTKDDKKPDGKDDAVRVETRTEVTPAEGVEKLKAQLDASNRERDAAKAREQTALRKAQAAQGQVNKSQMEQLVAYETTAKQVLEANNKAVEAAQDKWATAMESSDYRAAAKAQVELNEAQGKAAAAKHQLSQLDGYKRQMADSGNVNQPQRRNDAIASNEAANGEDTASRYGVDPNSRSGRWINANADRWETDTVFRNKALLADAEARKEGVALDSDDYFTRIEQATGLKEAPPPVTKEQPKIDGGTAAGASRQSGTSGERRQNQTPSTVRLSAAQMEAAAISGMTPVQYAKNLIALESEGKISRRVN